MKNNLSIAIVDPSMLFREGLRRILAESGFHTRWCSDALNIESLVGLLGEPMSLVVVGGEIEEASLQVSNIKLSYPRTKAVILADTLTPTQLITAIRCGADTVVLRDSSCDALIAVLRLAAEGAAVFPTGMIGQLVSQAEPKATGIAAPARPPATITLPPDVWRDIRHDVRHKSTNFSKRESDVLEQLTRGFSNKEIARELAITEATVKVHVRALFRKARVRNRTEVVLWAARQNASQDSDMIPAE